MAKYETFGLQAILDLTQFSAAEKKYVAGVSDMAKKNEQLGKATKEAFSAVKKVLAGAAGGIAAAGGAMLKLTLDAKEIPGVKAAFEGLGGSIEDMINATHGMVNSTELMKQFNSAAQLVSLDFAQRLPDAMQYLTKISRSTGESMDFMMQSLVRGVGRLSPMILDNLSIQVDLTKANEDYALSIGKTTDELTKQEEQIALMNQVIELLARNTASMPDAVGSADQAFASFGTSFKEIANTIGVALLPAFSEIMKTLQIVVSEYGPKLTEWAQGFGTQLEARVIAARDGFLSFVDTLRSISDFLGQFDQKTLAATATLAAFSGALVKVYQAGQAVVALGGPMAALNAIMAANPVILIAAGIVAAGVAISTVIQRLKDEEAEWEQQQDDMSRSIARTSASYAEYKERMLEALRASMDVGEHYPEQLILQEAEAKGLIVSAQNWESYSQIITGEVGPALQGLKDGMLDSQSAMEAQAGAAADFYQGLVDYANQMEQVGERLAAAIATDDVMDAFEEMRTGSMEIMEDMNAGFLEIQEKAQADQLDALFTFNLEQEQARQQFQANYNALIAAGRQEEAAALQAKFQEQQAEAEGAFSVQEQLRQRTILAQKITQQKAYIVELQMQRKAIIDRLTQQLLGDEKFLKLDATTRAARLAGIGFTLQEIEELERQAAVNRLKIAQESGEDVAQTLIDMAEIALKAQELNVGEARDLLAKYQQEMKDFTIDLPPLNVPGLNAPGASSISGASSSVSKAGESLTATLDEVSRDLNTSITNLQEALNALPDIQVDEAAYAGLERMGVFVQRAVEEVYSWFNNPAMDTKNMLDDVKEFLGPLGEVFTIIKTDLGDIVPSDLPTFDTDAALFFGQLRSTGIFIMDWLREINDNPVWVEALEKAAAITGKVLEVFKIAQIDISETVTDLKLSQEDIDVSMKQREMVGISLMDWLRKINDNPVWVKALTDAAEISGKVVEVFKVAQIDMSKVESPLELTQVEIDAAMLQREMVGISLMDWLRRINDNPVWVEALEEAAAITENVVEVFKVAQIDMSKVGVGQDFTQADFDAAIGQRKMLGISIMDWLREINDNPVWVQALEEAAGIADNIVAVFKVVGVELDKAMPSDTFTASGADAYVGQLKQMGISIMDWLREIAGNPVWVKALDEAAGIAQNVTKIFDVLDINLAVSSPGPGFLTRLTSFFTTLDLATPIIKEGIENIVANWEDAESFVEASGLSQTVKDFFDVLSLNDMINDLEIIKPLREGEMRTAFSNVVSGMFEDLIVNAPLIRDKLAEIDEIFGGSMDYSIDIANKIEKIFTSIGGAISSGMEIMNESDEDTLWNINVLLNRVADLALAMQAIGNLSWGTPDMGEMPDLTPPEGTLNVTGENTRLMVAVRDGMIEALQSEAAGIMNARVMSETIAVAIMAGIRGSEIRLLLDVRQAEEERRLYSARLGRIEQFMQTISIRLDAAGV